MMPLSASACICFWVLLSFFPGQLLSAIVTLESISIYKTHEWFKATPMVYFVCKGENYTIIPDVKVVGTVYKFKGQESWQPLTNFTSEKCKRCGFYEKDTANSDDTFDEWELCPSDFRGSDGKYSHIKEKEINATFLCRECVHRPANTTAAPDTSAFHKEKKGMHVALIIAISVIASTVIFICLAVSYKYWLKKKREQEQARFMKLFEDDDIEDELELSSV